MEELEETVCIKPKSMMEKSPKRVTRQLRDRKERKFYTDDWALGDADDEIEGPQSFDLEEKLRSPRFDRNLVKEMKGTEFNLAYIQQYGFTEPLIFHDKEGLGIKIPNSTFHVGDVRTCVGSKRLLDVMDVRTQKNMELSMKQWQEYYEKSNKDRLLNVISLEFSHTKLENFVEAPTVVRQLDWVDRVWPRHLKNMQTESTNVMDEMMYPKVQKYCLMSVKGCYTDFHVDFGGTSVWYHILKGAKVFWLIPPTDKNLEHYQTWVLSGKQGDTFFGDNVEICSRVYLQSGDTFFIPSGWIHAVYTPKDSLVFGGNFLHSFGIEKQLKIATVEEQTKVPQKFRYPFFTEMLWYTLERYVHCLIGHSYIRIATEDEDTHDSISERLVPEDVALSPQELLGLKAIVLYLHQLPIQRKNVPALIYDPVGLLRAIKQIVEKHRYDNPSKAVTGRPILIWPGEKADDVGRVDYTRRSSKNQSLSNFSCGVAVPVPPIEEVYRRRIRCATCQACNINEDCNECVNCNARLKHGDSRDPSPCRRVCVMRDCLRPQLPPTANCEQCGKDGWGEIPNAFTIMNKLNSAPSTLMECIMCLKIVHPLCISSEVCARSIAIVNEDLPNSWECPMCVDKSKPVRGVKRIKSHDEKRHHHHHHHHHHHNHHHHNHHNNHHNHHNNHHNNHHHHHHHHHNHHSNHVGENTGSSLKPLNSDLSNGLPVEIKIPKLNGTINNIPNGQSYSSKPLNNLIREVKLEIKEPRHEVLEAIIVERPKKIIVDKSLREDEVIVKQKIDLVVRRKSTEESMKAAVSKISSIKRALSATEVTKIKHQRRMSEEIVRNGEFERPLPKIPQLPVVKEPPVIAPIPDVVPVIPPKKLVPVIVEEELVEIKEEPEEVKDDKSNDSSDTNDETIKKPASPIKFPFRTDLSSKIIKGTGKNLKKPSNVVRTAPLTLPGDARKAAKKKTPPQAHTKDINIWLHVFKRSDLKTLNRALCVSKDWNRMGLAPELWEKIDLSQKTVTPDMLKGVVRRQPSRLVLNWTKISKQQLLWIISRLPQLKELSLQGSSWNTVSALKTCFCPSLSGLDLGYVDHLLDGAVREVLAPPIDSRPGLTDSKSRLRNLKFLSLAGAHLSDVSLRYVTQHAGSIARLDLSFCPRITDAGIAQLGAPDSPSLENLTHLYITGCPQLTNISLDHLKRCKKLEFLDVQNVTQISVSGLNKFLSQLSIGDETSRKIVVKSSFPPTMVNAMLHQPDTGPQTPKMMMTPMPKAPTMGNSVVVSIMP